jgi:radical SAM protein with 4Fe4S-binding SPASM domain
MIKDISRIRNEQLKALNVWEARRSRESFKEIAKELGIKETIAKKRFYSAYELIYGEKYDTAKFEKPVIKKAYLKRVCYTCKVRPSCKDPCPDVIDFANQDSKPC